MEFVHGVPLTPENARRVKIEVAKRARVRQYQNEPHTWLIDRFQGKLTDLQWSAWPEYQDHQWDGTQDPFLVAINAIKEGRDVGVEAATGVGKTYIAARIAYWFLDAFPNSAVITTSPTKEQLLQVLWKEIALAFSIFKKQKPNAELLTGDLRVNRFDDYGDDTKMVYTNRMTSKVGRKRAGEETNVSFQGIHNKCQLFILDEAAGLEPSVITSIKNTNTYKGEPGAINAILAIGNPDNVTDGLHQFCTSPGVVHVRVSAFDHPNVVLKRSVIPGAVTPASIDIRLKEYGEQSNLYRSRVRGIAPEQATDALIMLKWVMQCARYSADFQRDKFKPDTLSRPAVGVDVANSIAGDAACLAWGINNQLKKLHEFQCANATHLADNLVKDQNQLLAEGKNYYGVNRLSDYGVTPEYCGIDSVGVGVATFNQMSDLGYKAVALQGGCDETAIPLDKEEKPLYKFANLRAQMYFQARIDLQNIDLSIDIVERPVLLQLAKELTMVRYKLSDNHIVIEKKEDIKERLGGKSPNMADAFVYWNWMRKKRGGQFKRDMPVTFGYTESETEYDEHFDKPDPGAEIGIWKPDASQLD